MGVWIGNCIYWILKILDYNSQFNAIAISHSLQFTTHALGILGLLTKSGLLVCLVCAGTGFQR
jgi:hypothetical protein